MILSVSRRTDIPAFYSAWFINRLKSEFLCMKGYNNRISEVALSPNNIECIVFWTKNPEMMLEYLDVIDALGYKYYFQFTVTSYDTSIEVNVPKKSGIITTFKKLSDKIGPNRVIWRYDPILITDKFNIYYHMKWFTHIASALYGYTNKCVISFVDMYGKCKRNLEGINVQQIDHSTKELLVETLATVARSLNITVETCSENISSNTGVKNGKCIDDVLISKITGTLLHLGKDPSQRSKCGCVKSVDIGVYNTCKHGCKYCYANYSSAIVDSNYALHDKFSPFQIGI